MQKRVYVAVGAALAVGALIPADVHGQEATEDAASGADHVRDGLGEPARLGVRAERRSVRR